MGIYERFKEHWLKNTTDVIKSAFKIEMNRYSRWFKFFPWKLLQEYLIWSQGDDSVNKILAAQHKALSMFISSAPT